MSDLKNLVSAKVNAADAPTNNNRIQYFIGDQILSLIKNVEDSQLSVREFKRQIRLLKKQYLSLGFGGAPRFANGQTNPLEYTGMGELLNRAENHFG